MPQSPCTNFLKHCRHQSWKWLLTHRVEAVRREKEGAKFTDKHAFNQSHARRSRYVMKAAKYFHTVRHLKPVQVYARLWRYIYRPRLDTSPAPLRKPSGVWSMCPGHEP